MSSTAPHTDRPADGAWHRFWFEPASLVRLGIWRALVCGLALHDVLLMRVLLRHDAALFADGQGARSWNPIYLFDLLGIRPLSPFGVEVLWTAQVRDEDGILANGLTQASQVEVRGYLDGEGQAYATRVRERGNPDPADVRLVGPLETIADPLLQIQGLTIDTSGALFEDEIGTPMTAMEFYAVVQVGEEVGVSAASYDAASSTLSGGLVSWSGVVAMPPVRAVAGGGAGLIRAGTASSYALGDVIFEDGFE